MCRCVLFVLNLWSRSLSNKYFRIQSVPQIKHHTSPLQHRLVSAIEVNNPCFPYNHTNPSNTKFGVADWKVTGTYSYHSWLQRIHGEVPLNGDSVDVT
jgi:hypothetical protein